jgi:predicted ATPase
VKKDHLVSQVCLDELEVQDIKDTKVTEAIED